MDAWTGFERFMEPLLQNLDPSLFQNVILGILAIFIPFAIVFLTDILDPKKQRNEFEKMVLNQEILGTKKVFWLSVPSIAFLSFFAGTQTHPAAKFSAIVFLMVISFYLSKPFWKILRFSEGYKREFEIGFLNGLNLTRIFRFRNKSREEKMIKAWSSIWSEKSAYNEKGYTEAFMKHIDDAVESKKYELAITLAEAYQNNLNNNLDRHAKLLMAQKMLPKTLKWHATLWEAKQEWLKWLNRSETEKQKTFFSKHFQSQDETFWNWDYFQQKLFPAMLKILLHDYSGCYLFFDYIKRHIDEAETKLEKSENNNEKAKWERYITGLFGNFCPVLFENIGSVSNHFEFWKDNFPSNWKITTANSRRKRVPEIILGQFLRWAERRIFRETDYDEELSVTIKGLFPNVHPQIFSTFLVLLFGDIQNAIQRKQNFTLVGSSLTCSGQKSEEEIQQMFREKDQSERDETIDVIFEYFRCAWEPLFYMDDLSSEEVDGWNGDSKTQKKRIADRVRNVKLQRVLGELDSPEIMNLCKNSERKDIQRRKIMELIQSLIARIS